MKTDLSLLRREAEQNLQKAKRRLQQMKASTSLDPDERSQAEPQDVCTPPGKHTHYSDASGRLRHEPLMHSRVRASGQLEQAVAQANLGPSQRIALRRREEQEAEVRLQIHKAELEMRWMRRGAQGPPQVPNTFSNSEGSSLPHAHPPAVHWDPSFEQWLQSHPEHPARTSRADERPHAPAYALGGYRHPDPPVYLESLPSVKFGSRSPGGHGEGAPRGRQMQVVRSGAGVSPRPAPQDQRSLMERTQEAEDEFQKMRARAEAAEEDARAKSGAMDELEREAARLREANEAMQEAHTRLSAQNRRLVEALPGPERERAVLEQEVELAAAHASLQRAQQMNVELQEKLRASEAKAKLQAESVESQRALVSVPPQALRGESEMHVVLDRAAAQERAIVRLQTELESREKEVLAVTAEREQLEAKAAASQSENAHLRLLVDELRTQLSDADHAAQGAHDATDLLVETLKLHNNRLASEVQAYRGRCQSLERALQEIHLNAPSAETPAPNGQRKDLGRQTMARTPLEPLSQDDNYGETVANPLISLRGETAAPIRRETSDRACGPRPESEPQQGELQFYLNLASQPCDYLRVQRNEVVQRSLGGLDDSSKPVLFSDLVFEDVNNLSNEGRLVKSGLVVVAESVHSLSLNPHTMWSMKWSAPVITLVKITWDEAVPEELAFYINTEASVFHTVRTPRKNNLIGVLVKCWRSAGLDVKHTYEKGTAASACHAVHKMYWTTRNPSPMSEDFGP